MFVFDELKREDLGPKEMKELAYELATRALLTGLRVAGLSPEEAKEIELQAEIGRKVVTGGKRGGTKSGETRSSENKPWAPHATELAQAICSEHSDYSHENVALEIVNRWKLETPPPGVRWLATFVSKLRKDKKLPQRAK